jgi:hypothetical protein
MKELSFAEVAERRTRRWQQLNQLIAANEQPIDPKIHDLVITLNALGIVSSWSCQGHRDFPPDYENGMIKPYPWISFPKYQYADLDQFKLQRSIGLSIGDHMRLVMSVIGKKGVMQYEQFTTNQVLINFLDQFYAQRQMSQITKLHLITGKKGYTLENVGAPGHPNNLNQNDPAILFRFQKEMSKFGKYLKELYETQQDRKLLTELAL